MPLARRSQCGQRLQIVEIRELLILLFIEKISREVDRDEDRTEKLLKTKGLVVLVSQVPQLETLLKLAQLIANNTDLAADLLTTDNTRTNHDSNHLVESILVGDDGQTDKFDSCTKSQKK